jgi:ribosomal protein S18 acetylase RimI-like enzyme
MGSIIPVQRLTCNSAEIHDVVVDAKHRKHGLGRRIMESLQVFAKNNGYAFVELTSNPSRVAANKMYAEVGFVLRETNVWRLTLS